MSIIDGISVVNIVFKMGNYREISIAILLLASVFLISACGDTLVTTYPLSITSEKKDMSDLQGTWGSDSKEPFSIVFDSNGIAHLASLAWSDKKQTFDIEELQFVTTWWGNNKYLSFLKLNNVELGTYPLAQYNIQDDLLIFCFADTDIFRQAIEDKELSGFIKFVREDSSTIIITSDRDVLRQYLINNEDKQLFECEKESAKRRISADRPNGAFVIEVTANDEKETMEVMQEKARQGWPDAQWELYREYPTEENLIWLCQAADSGQAGARYELGKLYFYGSGRYRNFEKVRIPADLSMACMWSHLAGQAQIIDESGTKDVDLTSVAYDSAEVERAAKVMTTHELEEATKLINDWKPGQCDRDFALYLGAAYTQDSSLSGLCIAADHESMSARESLGRLFFFGSKGVDANLPRAYMWYHLAAQVYVPPDMAGGSMQFQCDSMTPEQRSVAVKLLEEWEPGKCEEALLQ